MDICSSSQCTKALYMENKVTCPGASRLSQAHVTAMLSARAASVPGAARQGIRYQPEVRRCAPRVPGRLREQKMLLSHLPGLVPPMPQAR